MLEHTFDSDHGLLYLSPKGPLAAEDFQAVAKEIDPFIEQNGSLKGLLITAEKFPGWNDFDSMISHLKFVRDHHKHVRRIAVVSDDEMMTMLPKLASHFVAAEVKRFASSAKAEAQAWIKS